jgi:RNA polymerase sigma-70 factor (ECF subfamily)
VSARDPLHEELLRHAGFVRALAGRLSADAHEADDLAQETLLAAVRRPPAGRRDVRGWLAAVVRNLARMDRRARRRRAAYERSARLPRAVERPDEAAARLELHRELVEDTLALPEPYRGAILARYFEGLAPAAIAARLGVPRKTVATRLRRALGMLRARLDRGFGTRAMALLGAAHARDRTATWTGVTAMAGKLTTGAAGFLLGAATTFVVTETARDRPEPRATAAERSVSALAAPGAVAPEPTSLASAAAPLAEADWVDRINATDDPKELQRIGAEIAALGVEPSCDLLCAIYNRIERPASRAAVAFAAARKHPYRIALLDLVAQEEAYDLRSAAQRALRDDALIDFDERPEAYAAWVDGARALTAEEAALQSAAAFSERLRRLRGEDLEREFRVFPRPPAALPAGASPALLASLEDVLAAAAADSPVRQPAWRWIAALGPDEAFLQRTALPALRGRWSDPDFCGATRALAGSGLPWVFDEFLRALARTDVGSYDRSDLVTVGRMRSQLAYLGSAFAILGDKRAIPHLIAAIAHDSGGESIYWLGWTGLHKLTGVRYDETHDAAWWLAWWDANRDGLPADVRALDPRRIR